MFLKKLAIYGFKSFADKTVLDFKDGVAGLIGPNGCGKSNIIDALRWVTGETSISALRGKKSEDIIFNGTAARKHLGYCEVAVTLDNAGRHFSAYDQDDITIKRRLYRDGESQFFINNNRCILKNIHEIFLDTGVGKAAYSIIGQGKIDAILSSKPDKRRAIFEEAAGIAKYKTKIREAERKLKNTEENILRINDIIFEVERSLKNLKVQAEKAKEYKELRNQIRDADIQLGLFKVDSLNDQKERISKRASRYDKQKEEVREKIEKVLKETEEKLKSIEQQESVLRELQAQSNDLDVQIRTSEHKIVMLREQHDAYNSTLMTDTAKAESIMKRLEEVDKYISLRQEEADNIDKKIIDYRANLEAISEELHEVDLTLKEHGVDLGRLKEQIENDRAEVASKRREQRKTVDELIALIDEKKKELETSHDLKDEIKTELLTVIERVESGLTDKRELLKKLLDDRVYADTSKQEDLKEQLYQVLFELETCTGYSEKIKEKFVHFTDIEDGFSGMIFDKQGIHYKKSEIDDSIIALENNIKDGISKIEIIEEDIERKRDTREKIYQMIGDIQISLTSLNEKKNAFSEEAKRTIEQKSEFEVSLKELESVIYNNQEKLSGIEEEIHSTIDVYETNKLKHRQFDDNIHRVSMEITEFTRFIQNLETEQRKLIEEERKIERQAEEVHLKVQEIEIKLKNILENFYENYSVNLDEFTFDKENFNQQELEAQKKKAKSKVNYMGDSVNLLAIEEYEEMNERYSFLIKNRSDLEEAKADLLRIISEINDISKQMFLATIEKIKVNFNRLFKRLFGGGRGEIKVLDPNNILESGIEIEVQPPSKKIQNIFLLSGGERTMTAVALLFAILQVKPSPFCLLDEVDAALDDINISRFVKMLKEFIGNTQFVIITHNPLTIEICDFLYGITMEEPGITKVYSMKPENKEKVVTK